MDGMQLLADGFKLMILGMGTVLSFLILMIFSMNLLAKVLKPFTHLLEAPPAPPKKSAASAGNQADAELAAVAAAAVALFREKQ